MAEDDYWQQEATRILKKDCMGVEDEDVRYAFARAQHSKLLYCDTETTGLNVHKDQVIGLSMSDEDAKDYGHMWPLYMPFGHVNYPGPEQKQANFDLIKGLYLELVKRDPAGWRFFHSRYDRAMLGRTFGANIPFSPEAYDVMHLSQLIEPNKAHGLKWVASEHLQVDRTKWDGTLDEYRKDQEYTGDAQVPPDIEAPYATMDVVMTGGVDSVLSPKIASGGLERVLRLETDLLPTITRISQSTIKVDQAVVSAASAPLVELMDEQKKLFAELSGWDGDIADDDKIRDWLYTTKGYPVSERDYHGEPSVMPWVLGNLAKNVGPDIEIVKALSYFRKSLSIWRKTYESVVVDTEGICDVPMGVRQIKPAGYWETDSPPLAAWNGQLALGLRKAFIIPPDRAWVCIQAQDLPLTMIASGAQDSSLKAACSRSADIIGELARSTGLEAPTVAAVLAGKRKGMGRPAMFNEFNLQDTEVAATWNAVAKSFPAIRQFNDQSKATASRGQPLVTALGRRVWLPMDKAWRAPGQFLIAKEADLWKQMTVAIDRKLQGEGAGGFMFPIEHGLVFEINKNYVTTFLTDLRTFNQKRVDKGLLPLPWIAEVATRRLDNIKQVPMPIPQMTVATADPEAGISFS